MNWQAKLKRIADAARGIKGSYTVEIEHQAGCPAGSSGNILRCACDFVVTAKAKRKERGK